MARAHLLTAGWALFVLALLLVPETVFPPGPPGVELPAFTDKLVHAALFAVLAVLARRSCALLPGCRRPLLSAIVFAVAWGALSEALQGLTATRTPELADLVADGLGAIVAPVVLRRSGKAPRPDPPLRSG